MTGNSAAPSVSEWISGAKTGDDEAIRLLWERYAPHLRRLARRRLGGAPIAIADEEDVALSVFKSLCRGARAGRFGTVGNRQELWWLLLAITRKKAVSQLRREAAQKRGGLLWFRSRRADDQHGRIPIEELISSEPTPDLLVMIDEQRQRLLSLLHNDSLRRIAMWRIEGFSIVEIADRLKIAKRTVERKLHIIRESWARELGR